MNKEKNARIALSLNVWQIVKSDLELRILKGDFAPGERIPSIRKIAEDYGVGQTTAQKVLNVLWQEGIIEPHRGVGFFVKPYVREQLIASRKKIIEVTMIRAIEEAALINVDLLPMIERCAKMKEQKK